MKKTIFILLVFIIAVGGFIMKLESDKNERLKDKEQTLVIEAKQHMEQYIKEGYQSIKQIDFSSEYNIDPTGGVEVTGYLNNDRNKKFSGIYDSTNKKIGVAVVDAEEK